ncbi:MAG: M24 family metallopeptidase, partial [bacterium]
AYAEHHDTPMRGLAEVLQEKGLAQARIALETRYLPAHSYLELGRELPNASFFDAAEVLNQTRMIKSQDEIDLMRRIALAAEKAIEYGFLFSRPGDTELEVVERMQRALHDLGGEWNPFVTLAAGAENTTKKHYSASAKPIRPGDIIHVDMVGFWQGYYTDFARMGVVQNPEDGQREAYRRVIDVQRHVMEVARPGVHACDLYESCAEYSRQIGMPFNMNIIGHSLGIGLHEYPILGPAYEQKLEANMMLCIEVGSEVPGLGRYHVEDLILISEDRNILLTDHMDTSEMTVVR